MVLMEFWMVRRVILEGGKTGMLFHGENWDGSEEALKTENNGSTTGCLFYI
jgi:hypothetical protein